MAYEYLYTSKHQLIPFEKIEHNVNDTLKYLDIRLDKDYKIFECNEDNGNFENIDMMKVFKKGSYEEVKAYGCKMGKSDDWEKLWMNAECLYVYMEDGQMIYKIK
jgi:hypothetical protein